VKIFFLIRSLNQGGAERQLSTLCKSFSGKGHEITVGYFYAGGTFENDLRNMGVSLLPLGKKGRWDFFLFLIKLIGRAKEISPDIIYSFFGPSNVFSIFLKPFLNGVKIVWGIRASNMDLSRYNWFWRFAYFLEKRLANFADLIIANSYSGKEYSAGKGFPSEKIKVISNGIDTHKFKPETSLRKKIREEWGISDNERVIGIVARIDPMKDYVTFLQSAKIVSAECNNIRFVCVGEGEMGYQNKIRRISESFGLDDEIIWTGAREDMTSVYNGIDLLCLSSAFGEGFPNVIGEAMACCVPCVVTDVGDSSFVVGETGIIVPPRKPEFLAKGLKEMVKKITKDSDRIKRNARERIIKMFGNEKMATLTENELRSLL
jgi:glycosyltransferase involved in cell wall biosynthesis